MMVFIYFCYVYSRIVLNIKGRTITLFHVKYVNTIPYPSLPSRSEAWTFYFPQPLAAVLP